MEKYTIYCTEEQTKKAIELGAPIVTIKEPLYNHPTCGRDWVKVKVQGNSYSARIPTAEQMIGFILDSGRGYSIDLSELIREQGYKQGCLTFIDNCLK